MRTVLIFNSTRELMLSGASGASSRIDNFDLPQGALSQARVGEGRRQTVRRSAEDNRICIHQVTYAQTAFLLPIKHAGVSSFRAVVTKPTSQAILLSSLELPPAKEDVDAPEAEYAVPATTHKKVVRVSDRSLRFATLNASLGRHVRSGIKPAFDELDQEADNMQIGKTRILPSSKKG